MAMTLSFQTVLRQYCVSRIGGFHNQSCCDDQDDNFRPKGWCLGLGLEARPGPRYKDCLEANYGTLLRDERDEWNEIKFDDTDREIEIERERERERERRAERNPILISRVTMLTRHKNRQSGLLEQKTRLLTVSRILAVYFTFGIITANSNFIIWKLESADASGSLDKFSWVQWTSIIRSAVGQVGLGATTDLIWSYLVVARNITRRRVWSTAFGRDSCRRNSIIYSHSASLQPLSPLPPSRTTDPSAMSFYTS